MKIFSRLCVCGACEGRGAVARQKRRGPALPHPEKPGRPHPQTHADIQGQEYLYCQAQVQVLSHKYKSQIQV